MSDPIERAGWAWMAILLLVIFFVFWALPATFESAAYNRITGAKTTWWDALWLELRVEGGAK